MILEDLLLTMISGVTLPVISSIVLFSFLPFKLKLRVLEKISPFWSIRFPRGTAEFYTDFIPFFLAWFWFMFYWVLLMSATAPTFIFSLNLWGLFQIFFEALRSRLIPEESIQEDADL